MSLKPEDKFIVIAEMDMSLPGIPPNFESELQDIEREAIAIHEKVKAYLRGELSGHDPVELAKEAERAMERLNRLKDALS